MSQNVCFKYNLGQKVYWVRDNRYKEEFLVKSQINTNCINNPIRYAIEKYGSPQRHRGYMSINEIPEAELFQSYQDAINSLY